MTEHTPAAPLPTLESEDFVHGLHPKMLFFAYHLGLLPDGTRRFLNAYDVAKEFGVSLDAIHDALNAYGFSSDEVVHSDFDMSEARVDVELADTIDSARAAAQLAFASYTQNPRGKRDWVKELESDR